MELVGDAAGKFRIRVIFAIRAEHDRIAGLERVQGMGVVAAQMFQGAGASENRVEDAHSVRCGIRLKDLRPLGNGHGDGRFRCGR